MHWLFIVILILFMISFSIFLTVNSVWLFRFILHYRHIPEALGLSTRKIVKNYHQLLVFLQVPWISLNMPDFPTSFSGLHHFEDVKKLILLNNFVLLVTVSPSVYYIKRLFKLSRLWLLDLPFRIAAVVPIVVAAIMSVNFNAFFIKFHEVFFRNQDWLFDPQKDPIILVLPESFFYLCFALAFIIFELELLIILIAIRRQIKKASAD